MKKILPANAILVPDKAQKVFTGQIFDVYQWPQKMFDGTTKTFEMLGRPDTVQIIAVQDKKLVLIEDQQPGRPMQVHIPGGRADEEDTSWLVAAKREMREETGKTFKNWRQLTANQPAAKIEWFTPIFLATDLDEQLEQELDVEGEKINVLLEDFDKVRSLTLSGEYAMLSYLMPFFARVTTIEQLLSMPELKGQEVDR